AALCDLLWFFAAARGDDAQHRGLRLRLDFVLVRLLGNELWPAHHGARAAARAGNNDFELGDVAGRSRLLDYAEAGRFQLPAVRCTRRAGLLSATVRPASPARRRFFLAGAVSAHQPRIYGLSVCRIRAAVRAGGLLVV